MSDLKRNDVSKSPFNHTKTGMPTFDDMLKDPEYFERAKGRVFSIEWLEPAAYIRLAATGFRETEEHIRAGRQNEYIQKYARMMENGTKFDMPVLDYSTDYFSQEGLHRAMAAEAAGFEVMPVMVVRSVDRNK